MKNIVMTNNGHRRRAVETSNGRFVGKHLQVGNPATELSNTPVLWKLALMKSLVTAGAFANKRTLIVLHALGNLRAMIRAMMMLGLDAANTTVFVKRYNYPEK